MKTLLLHAPTLSWLSVLALCACSSSSSPTMPYADASNDAQTTTDASTSDGAGNDSSIADAADAADATGDAATTTHTVQVGQTGFSFTPSTLTIKAGDTVTWNFVMAGHTVTSGTGGVADGKFCSPNDMNCSTITTNAAGTTYSHTFTTAGDYPYFCAVHFASGMTGTITVTP